MRLSGQRFKVIVDRQAGHRGGRISFRFRSLNRPYQINFTITRYIPAKKKGVS